MPITIAFTLSSLVAAIFNTWFLLKAINQRILLYQAKQNGELAVISNTLIKIWIVVLLADLLILAAGIGILTGFRILGYLIAVMPIASMFVGVFALRGLLTTKKVKTKKGG